MEVEPQEAKTSGQFLLDNDPGLFLLCTHNILIALDFDPFLTNSQLCGADNYTLTCLNLPILS